MAIRGEVVVEKSATSQFFDNDYQYYGTGQDVAVGYDQSDANANLLKTDFLAGGAAHVPVHVYGVDIADRDLGFFNGRTEPLVAVVDLARTSWVSIGFRAAGEPAIEVGGTGTMLYLPNVTATEVTIYSAENLFYLTESDQTDPAGRWRFRLNGDILYLERATAASWASDEDWLTLDKGNSRIGIGKDLLTDRWQSYVSNTFVGINVVGAGNLASGAENNSAFGNGAMRENTTGNGNAAFGSVALSFNTGGHYNSGFGASALYSNTTGAYNCALGAAALRLNTTGLGNIGVGYNAGDNITTGSYNIIIGYGIDAPSATTNYQIVIGDGTNQGQILGDNAGDMTINALSTKSFHVAIAGTDEYDFSAATLAMNVNTITEAGDILCNDAAGPTLQNEAATTTNPTLIPNRADETTGIGWNTAEIHIVISGGDEYGFSATTLDMNANTITECGTITANDAAGPTIVNEAATNTNPTLCPNRAEDDTGIGWSSDALYLVLGGAEEYGFSTTSFDLNSNTVDEAGTISATNAAGPAIVNEAATSTNPTLCPNRAELDTGIGWTSTDIINIVLGGVNEYSFSTTSADFNANTIDDVGTISVTDAAGPSIANEAATTTNPTLIPNRAEMDTGIGWASDTLHIVLGGASYYNFTTTGLNAGSDGAGVADLLFYGATSGCYVQWDASGDDLIIYGDIHTDRWQQLVSNTFFGVSVVGAGNLAAAGYNNCAFGNGAMRENTTGSGNSAFGYAALAPNTIGHYNAAFGGSALAANTEGLYNTAVGAGSLLVNTTGKGNTAVGYGAGRNITTGDYNTAIGHWVQPPSATADYQIEIGDGVNQGRLRNDNAGDWTIYSPSGKVIKFQPDGDTSDYVTLDTVSDVPTWYATGSYMRFGDAATTQVSLASEDDVMVSGKLEVYGITYHTGVVFIGDANVTAESVQGITTGIQIDQGAADDCILVFKSSDIAHGITSLCDTDTYGFFMKLSATAGGISFFGVTETSAAFSLRGVETTAVTTKSTAATAAVQLAPSLKSGTTETTYGADANLVVILNRTTAKFIFDSDGDFHTTDVVCGFGEGGTTAVTGGELRAPDLAAATNQAGADLTISAGAGTGNGDVGQIIFQTPRVQVSGTTVHTKTTIMTMDEADINLSGYLVLYNTDTDSAVEGAVWFSETDKNIEFYDGTAVKVVAEVAGISFLPEERVMFDHRWELDDLGLVKIDKIKPDGSPHGLLYPFNQALAEAEEILALKQRVTDLEAELAEIRRG